jgi:Periplasmic binding protein
MKRYSSQVGLAILVAISAILPLHMPAKAADTPPIKIGVLTDMTGPLAETTGKGSVIAVQMAVEDFGGKVLGRSIDVLSADHQNKAECCCWHRASMVRHRTRRPDYGPAKLLGGLGRSGACP